MSTPPQPIPEVQKLLGASATRKVLVVEGPDDDAVYTAWLKKIAGAGGFSSKLEVINAGGKGGGGGRNIVLQTLVWFRDEGGDPNRLFGLVDRDSWDDATVASKQTELPQLLVNSDRHAIESCFCDPDEIKPALLAMNAGWTAQIAALKAAVQSTLDDFVDHWALLTTTERIKDQLVEQGYPSHLTQNVPIPADNVIEQSFQDWSTTLDSAAAFTQFTTLRTTGRAASVADRCRKHVWAKDFFRKVIIAGTDGLNTLVANQSARDWMLDIVDASPTVSSDIEAILQPLLT